MNNLDQEIQIKGILMNSGKCVVSANDFDTVQISGMITIAKNSNAFLTIKDAGNLDPVIVASINLDGKNNVVLDFT